MAAGEREVEPCTAEGAQCTEGRMEGQQVQEVGLQVPGRAVGAMRFQPQGPELEEEVRTARPPC